MDWPIPGGGRWQGTGHITASTQGITLTGAGVQPNIGTFVPLMTGTAVEGAGLMLSIADNSAATRYMLHVGLGTGTPPENTGFIKAIHMAYPRANQAGQFFYFPVHIPRGSRVSLGLQSATSGATLTVVGGVVGQGFGSPAPPSRVTTYGAAVNAASGTHINPGGTAHTEVITTITNSTTAPMSTILIAIGQRANTTMTTARWLWRVLGGPSGSEVEIVPRFAIAANTTDDDIEPSVIGPIPIPPLPSGSRLQIGAQCSINDATDRILEAVIYGID